MKRFALTTILYFVLFSFLNAQQLADADLLNDGNIEEIKLVELTNITNGIVYPQGILLKELVENESGYAEFEIHHLDNCEVIFSFEEQGTGGQTYSVHLNNGAFHIPNSSVQQKSYNSEDVFRIERCDEGIFIGKNNIIHHVFTGVDFTKAIDARLEVVQTGIVGEVQPNVEFSFPNPITTCSNIFVSTPDCEVNPSITDAMFSEIDTSCGPDVGVIFTYDDFQNLSVGQDSILGIPVDSLTDGRDTSSNNVADMLAGAFGDMSLADVYDCLEIGCSPSIDSAQVQLDSMAMLFGEPLTSEQLAELDSALIFEGEDPDSIAIFYDSLGSIETFTNDLGGLEDILNNLNLDSLIAGAFGAMEGDCNGSIWDSLGVNESSSSLSGEGGGEAVKKEIKQSIKEALKMALLGNGGVEGGDPNWFLGEIEGLGESGSSSMMPSPSATSTIEAIQSGVNLYNGTGSFSYALDNISAKDVAVPIMVNGSPGGMKVNDQEGLLGNMNLSSGGKVTRVVKGLPDEFNGTIDSYGYGYKRGLRIVTEFYGVNLGLDTNIKPKFLRKIICKIVNVILKKLIKFDNGGIACDNNVVQGDSLSSSSSIIEQVFDQISGDSAFLGDNQVAQKLAELQSQIDSNSIVKFLTNPKVILDKDVGVVNFNISWKPLEANYIATTITGSIPLGVGGLVLSFGATIRVGAKVVDLPSPVNITKEGIGYTHLVDSLLMDSVVGVTPLDINEFFDLDKKEKLKYLNKAHPTKKRDDVQFFDPKAFSFLEVLGDVESIFNTDAENTFPRYHTQQIDFEPDEYYYDFGGYSGKFYFQPDGEIILVPYQDFFIEIENDANKDASDILKFTFTTPEGVKYSFDKKATAQYNHYSLPTFFRYPENDITRTNFSKPEIGYVEYPSYTKVLGLPFVNAIKKDYLTNYHVEEGPTYTSAWHVTEIESLMSREKINLEYRDQTLHYNSNKNWTHTFPNFGKESNGDFKTELNDDINVLDLPREWKNGFADMTYSISEANMIEPYVKKITNNRGKTAEFNYDIPNKSLQGASLCSSIDIFKNNNFYKGWKFEYTTPDYLEINATCTDTSTLTTEGQSPAFSVGGEYELNNKDPQEDEIGDFLFYFPISIRIICIKFNIPLRFKVGTPKREHPDYYYLNATREITSLLHLKTLLGLNNGQELTQYQGEYIRNYLYTIKETNEDDIVATFDYNGNPSDLPKRFGMNQDIWGYYNGASNTRLPFIQEVYKSHIQTGIPALNTDHFAFDANGTLQYNSGRAWEADTTFAKIGQLKKVTSETGGYTLFNYDLHQYPIASTGLFAQQRYGGLRVASIFKGSNNGPTKKTTYQYLNPTVVNFPIFTDQHYLDTYYKNLEEKVKTSWMPINEWQMNKGGYVGYGQVNELYEDNGRVEHYFTNPSMAGFTPQQPYTVNLHSKYNRVFRFPLSGNGNQQELENDSLAYHPTHAPLIARDWRLGLEQATKIYNDGDTLLQESSVNYSFAPMMGDTGVLMYPKTNMYQYLHYGSVNDWSKEGILYQIVDDLTVCPQNELINLLRFIFKFVFTQHPYRYIEKDFLQARILLESEKVEADSAIAISYFIDGKNSSLTTTTYNDDYERKVASQKQSFYVNDDPAPQQTTSTVFEYADNIDATSYSFLDQNILDNLDDINFEAPIHQISKLEDVIVGGSMTDFSLVDSLFLPQTVWKYREDSLVLTGKFDTYDKNIDPDFPNYKPSYQPTKYKLAKYGTGYDINNYGFFPEITMKWNGNLLMKERTFSVFNSINEYNLLCQLETATDVNGLITNYTYDARQRLMSVVSPDDLQTTTTDYVMNPFTITTTASFKDGTPSQGSIQKMDGWGNALEVERHDGRLMAKTIYDNQFRPTKQFQLSSDTTTIFYEASPLGRVLKTIDAVGNETTTEYLGPNSTFANFNAFVGTAITDPNGHTSQGWADALGKNVVSISGAGGITKSKYDERARPYRIFNPIGETYQYEYNDKTGMLAMKGIPNKGVEKFWYDESMRMVAKSDSNNNILTLEYDNEYRLKTIRKVNTTNYGDPMTVVLNEGEVGTSGSLLLENTYLPNKTWLNNVKEGILKNGGVNGQKITQFQYDPIGRVIQSTSDYGTGIGTVAQSMVYTDANLVTQTTSNINGLGQGVQTLLYNHSFDGLLRRNATSLTYQTVTTQLDSLVYNAKDQVFKKVIGGGLQTVDYEYDDAGKLLNINSPNEHQCVKEISACQLWWGSAESMNSFDSDSCGTLVSVTFDGTTYTASNPIPSNNAYAMEYFVDSIITDILKLGECEVHYQEIAGSEELHFSIMNTNILTGQLQFTNCNYDFQEKDCCTITAIDPSEPIVVTPNPDLFYEGITYDGLDISMIETVGNCDAGLIRNYYTYDADHRLTKAQNELYQPLLINDALTTTYTYDPAGNIQTLTRRGWVEEENQFMNIDNLTYTYSNGNSLLSKVVDNTGPATAQQKGFGKNNPTSNYGYDGNGNMITDDGKGITNINYNLLNLPENISINGNSIQHEYTFSGEKIKKTGEETRIYIGGVEFRNDTLSQINISNGRILKDTVNRYQYNLTDHLGNVVVLFEDVNGDGEIQQEIEVIQRNHYYSFGLRVEMPELDFGTLPRNFYLYNGKELNTNFDLNWFDYGARWYNPAIARWNAVEPLSKKYYPYSPYNYAINNPLTFIDIDGRDLILSFSRTSHLVRFKQLVEKSYQGKIKVNFELVGVNENDETLTQARVTFTTVEDLDSRSSRALKSMMRLVNWNGDTHLTLVENDPEATFGHFNTGKLDISDLEAAPELDQSKDEQTGPTSLGKIFHEVWEQYLKQNSNKKTWDSSHPEAIIMENTVNGNDRKDGAKGSYRQNYKTSDGTIYKWELRHGEARPTIEYRFLGTEKEKKN